MADASDMPADIPRAYRIPFSSPPPRLPSPDRFQEPYVDTPSPSHQENNITPGHLLAPTQSFASNDASPAGKKTYYQSRTYASIQKPNFQERRRQVRLSMSGKSVIVEYEDFMKRFVPAPPGQEEPTNKLKAMDFSKVPTKPEVNMYEPLMTALNHDWLLPEDVAISNANTPDPSAKTKNVVDAGLYRRADKDKVGKKTKWAYMELSIECKTEDVQHDPFNESKKSGNHEDASDIRKQILGQIMCYAGYVFDNQQRMHHFMLIIFADMARIICWDRAGLTATQAFNYVTDPLKLGRFIWRFARMTPAQRGHDPTAVRVPRDSVNGKLMLERAQPPKSLSVADDASTGTGKKQAKKRPKSATPKPVIPGDYPRAEFEKSLEGDAIWWRLRVDDSKQGSRYFLVGKPHFVAPGLAGRGTHTFIAIDEADPYGPFVYLKDAWRVAHTGIDQEGKILERLNSDDDGGPVPYVPSVRFHGDVEDQVTRSQEVWLEQNKGKTRDQCPLKTHRHYRLVVNEVGRPLALFKNMKELIGLVTLCLKAHGEAYNRKKLIHRDISAGNVLIYPELVCDANGVVTERPRPLLADWELAKRVDDPKEAPRQPDRTGTWQFMSASALSQPSKRIIVQDDVESFFHLVLYHAIRFIPHNCLNVGSFMEMYFDGHIEEHGVYYGGKDKLKSMENGELTTPRGFPLCFYVGEEASEDLPDPSVATPSPSITQTSDAASNSPSSSSVTNAEDAPRTHEHVIHPVTKLLEDCLLRLKAHYTLYVTQKSTDSSSHKQSHVKKATDVDSAVTSLRKKRKPTVKQPKVLSPAERAELEILAAKLADHSEMIDLFAEHYEEGDWPDDDRCPDQLPKDYKPNYNTLLATGGSKRAAGSAFETSAHQAKRSRVSGI